MGNWWKKLESLVGGDSDGPNRVKVLRWLLIIALIGVGLMILNSFIHVKKVDPIGSERASPPEQTSVKPTLGIGSNSNKPSFREYEQAYEDSLKNILEKIVGVDNVNVMVTIDSTEELKVAQNNQDTQQTTVEKDKNGGTRQITNVTRSGEIVLYQVSGHQEPLVLTYIKPKIRGVVVVAKGAENIVVKKMMIEAVERGLGVPAYRISVLPSKQ